MSRVLDGGVDRLVDLSLEGENGEHAVREAGNAARSPRPPRPDLGRDEIDHPYAGTTRSPTEAHVELGEVDEDESIRALGSDAAKQGPIGAVEGGHPAHRLREADHGMMRGIRQDLHARRGHAGPAHADEVHGGLERAEGAAQGSAVEVAGGFPGRDHDDRAVRHGHRYSRDHCSRS